MNVIELDKVRYFKDKYDHVYATEAVGETTVDDLKQWITSKGLGMPVEITLQEYLEQAYENVVGEKKEKAQTV